jgi:phosphate transport system substrate-binding protein
MAPRASKAAYTKKFDLSGLPRYVPERQVSGTLRIAGNNYIGDSPLARWWTEGFRNHQPGIAFELFLPSAAVAIPSLYLGRADLAMNHEPGFYDLLGHLRIFGHEPTGISAFTGSYDVRGWQNTIVIVVNKANPLTRITMKQLDGTFGSARDGGWVGTTWHPEFKRGPDRDIRRWGQLGLGGEWADKPINVYGYSPRYATAVEFSNKVLQASDKWNGDLRAFGNWRRPDGTIYGQAQQILDLMKEDPHGLAYVRFDAGFPPELRVLALAESDNGPYVEFTIENVQNRSYPLWGDQSFWVSVRPGTKMDPKVREFLRYVLSQEGQEAVQRDGKYLPLTAEVVRQELPKLE